MKILQVIPYFAPAWDYGGPVRVCYELSKELAGRGHAVTAWATDVLNAKNRIGKREEVLDGIRVRRFKNLSNLLAYNHHLFISPDMLLAVRKELRDFDIVHMHEYHTLQNLVVRHYAKKYSIPYVLHTHGSLPKNEEKQGLKQVYNMLWGHKLLRDAAKVVAFTETEAKEFASMGVSKGKIEIVPNGIDVSEFEKLPERGQFRGKFGLNSGEKLILYLGRIHKTKGLDLLAKAFAGLSRQMDYARLVIVGAGDGYLLPLKRLIDDLGIGDKTLFTGPLYGEDKLAAYVDADVHVSLRSWEPFGLTLIESCACGTPVICSQKCGIADILCGQAGLAIPYDEEQLRDALLRILSDEKLRREYGEKGKSLVRQQFAWSKIAGQVENLYQQILAEHH